MQKHILLAFLVSVFFITSCGQSGSVKTPDPAVVTEEANAPGGDTVQPFVAVPGKWEFSGRMVARPLQADSPAAVALTAPQLSLCQSKARIEVSRYHIIEHVRHVDEYIFDVPADTNENELAKKMMATGAFQYVEPDWLVAPAGCPDDEHFSSQWHHKADRMRSCDAWTLHTGSPTISVGICDTGVLTSHEDLQLHRLEGYNAASRLWESAGGSITPATRHGTMTTGIVAANGNNGKGVAGVGWNLGHRMLRVTNMYSGLALITDLRHAARVSIQSGDKVVCIGYNGVDKSEANLTTATYIKSIGGLLLWATGSGDKALKRNNRDADDLIVVGATDSTDSKASFSNYGSFVDLMAPGAGIFTTDSTSSSSYYSVSGTSYACPMAAGVCAMIWSANPYLTPDAVENILKQSADDLGAIGVDDTYGYGRVNLYNAVVMALSAGGGGGSLVANFVGNPTSGDAPLSVQFTDQSTGSPTSWAWDFGDGGTSTARYPRHTYTTAGTYTVSLTVTNATGSDPLVRTDYITANTPSPYIGEGFILSKNPDFSTDDRAFSRTETIYMRVWSNKVDFNNMKKSEWELSGSGGGRVKQGLTNHLDRSFSASFSLASLPSSGTSSTFKCKLEDNSGARYLPSAGITVATSGNQLVADFVGIPTSGTAPLQVTFTDKSMGLPTSWSWEFGDGGTSLAQDPQHTYTAAGLYSVTLTVSNASGSDPLIRTNYITVSSAPSAPVADFVAIPASGMKPLDVIFLDQSSNSPTSWRWDFGNSGTSTSRHPRHTYTTAGTYTVTLVATNAIGSDTRVRTNYITVNEPSGCTGEGFILSKHADFSTDDRTFARSDTIHMMMWSDKVVHTSMKRTQYELRGSSRGRMRHYFTNNGDGTFSASVILSGIPSSATSWTFKGEIEDRIGGRYQATASFTVQ